MESCPRITLVTPSYNQGSYIEETMCSVLEQKYPALEYVVMDGGSTDGTVEIIRRYERHLKYWRSAPDSGQAAAIREGFAKGTGELLNWLNSDDLLAADALKIVAEMAGRAPDAAIYAATTENFLDGQLEGPRSACRPANLDLETLLFLSGRKPSMHQPGIFFRRDLYDGVGGVEPSFHYCMDLDLFTRLIERGAVVEYDARTVAFFRCHPKSKTASSSNIVRTVAEYMQVAESVGKRIRRKPNHLPHLKTLAGGALIALSRREAREACRCVCAAARIATPGALAREACRWLVRRAASCRDVETTPSSGEP
jgi:glycosyltransferase involved in cell wall biosynthesis